MAVNTPATFRAISGLGGKGPACFVIETAGKRLMLDLGYGPDPDAWPDIDNVGKVDAVLLSHGHRDHVGALSRLDKIGNPPVYATDIVGASLPRGIVVKSLPIRGTVEVLGIAVETGRNGHAPGGIWMRLSIGEGFLYMGDNSAESFLYVFDPPPRAGAMTLDASYGDYQRALTDCADDVLATAKAGPLLLPAPADGRGPEIALHLLRNGITEFFGDDAFRATFARLPEAERISVLPDAIDDLKRLATLIKPIDGARGVIIAGPADCASGTTATLINQWESQRSPDILFTGYLPPGAPAQRLVHSGRARYLRWNVHPRLTDNIALVRAVGPKIVIPTFCDPKFFPVLSQALAPATVVTDLPVTL